MTPEQFSTFLESNEQATGAAINKFVNGRIQKIDDKLTDHIKKFDAHTVRVEPVIKAYEESEAVNKAGTKYGKRAIFWSKVLMALGFLYGAFHLFLTDLTTWKP